MPRMTQVSYPSFRFGQFLTLPVVGALLLAVFTVFYGQEPQVQFPIGPVAEAAYLHTSLSYNVAFAIMGFQGACTKGTFDSAAIHTLGELYKPFDAPTAALMEDASLATIQLRRGFFYSGSPTTQALDSLVHLPAAMELLLTTIHSSTAREVQLEEALEKYANQHFIIDAPEALNQLQTTFDAAEGHMDVIRTAKRAFLENIESSKKQLGLVKPWYIRRKTWDANPRTINTLRTIQVALEAFQEAEDLQAQLAKAKRALLEYQEAPFIFDGVDDMPISDKADDDLANLYRIRLGESLPALAFVIHKALTTRFS